ncbi:hypothetical protein COV49_00635 [Candidatus Falkowbacteria bacterium CG11_big_fil_rev_8_21_14_0_20_39_10]|uniref:Uncharacterized protein n=1 Tax=Candidatus Falkowbacteria bacterium CG11_big_fil_rev_8_21_14_0_20_39_10 TaxID=1974570 RepID=A0A2M6KA66_9BACT|nr:MAG: hypothetical protein COV49_00635 [Candidatus Falkowbacteria bacterium CG11_big_fil_rev_8_21_14_0_20_39_10]
MSISYFNDRIKLYYYYNTFYMNKQNYKYGDFDLEKETEKKYKKRDKKKKPKMRVSGSSVKKLQEIITKK